MTSLERKEVKLEVRDIPELVIQKIAEVRKKIDEANDFRKSDFYPELFELINNLTKRNPDDAGMFLDKRNANHVVNATREGKKYFEISDELDPKLLEATNDGHSFFYFSINGNPYISHKEGERIIIFSPENSRLKLLLRFYLRTMSKKQKENMNTRGAYGTQIPRIKIFLKNLEQDLSGIATSYDWGYVMLEIEKTLKFKWEQIASCIVDLSKKKVYFFD